MNAKKSNNEAFGNNTSDSKQNNDFEEAFADLFGNDPEDETEDWDAAAFKDFADESIAVNKREVRIQSRSTWKRSIDDTTGPDGDKYSSFIDRWSFRHEEYVERTVMPEQAMHDGMYDAMQEFLKTQPKINQELFYSICGEDKLQKDFAEEVGRDPASISRTKKTMAKNYAKYLQVHCPEVWAALMETIREG